MPARVLHIVSVMNCGGIETLLMNIFRCIDRSEVMFDFLSVREDDGFYDGEIISLGGRHFKIPSVKKAGYIKFKKNIKDFFLSHPEYTVVHCHLNTLCGLVLPVAKKAGVKVRAAHSHNTEFKYPFPLSAVSEIWRKKIPSCATHLFACSNDAAKALYGDNAARSVIIKNGIDVEKFVYTKARSEQAKKSFGIEDKLVIGHVGRFSRQKNHTFLIDVFAKVCETRDDAVLLLVGQGTLEGQIKQKASEKGVLDKIIFAGVRADVENCLSAMDVFAFPSLYEGLGIAAIEAQASGLPCVFSEGVPTAACICDNTVTVPTANGDGAWAKAICEAANADRRDRSKEVSEAGYDIVSVAEKLKEFYVDGTLNFR